VLTHQPHVIQRRIVPLHANLLPARPPPVRRPSVVPGRRPHNLEPYDPITPSPSGCCR
jgi:hypothetical protein